MFVLRTGRFFAVYICFKETLFFNFLHKLFNKYLSLLQSTCQFQVSVRKQAKMVMRMYIIFIILLWNYEKAVPKFLGSSGRDCVLIILFQLYGSKTGLFESDFFWLGQYEPSTPNLHIGKRTNPKIANIIL